MRDPYALVLLCPGCDTLRKRLAGGLLLMEIGCDTLRKRLAGGLLLMEIVVLKMESGKAANPLAESPSMVKY